MKNVRKPYVTPLAEVMKIETNSIICFSGENGNTSGPGSGETKPDSDPFGYIDEPTNL